MFKYIITFIFLIPQVEATVWQDFASPVTTQARNPFLISAGLTLTSAIMEDSVSDPAQEDTVEDRPLGAYSKYGDLMGQLVPNAIYSLGMLIDGAVREPTHYDNSLLMFKATAYAATVTTILKYSIHEKRPNGGDHLSFPSGHTTTAFAFSSVVGALHSWPWAIAGYAVGGLVAYSRMNDNAHYLHDVLGGASIGLGYGLGLYYRQKLSNSNSSLYLLPTKNGPPHLVYAVNF